MAYTQMSNDVYIASIPAVTNENDRAIQQDRIVDAGKLNGLINGNATGNIPVSNGTICTNLNAEKLGGNLASAFATAGHTHSVATTSSNGLMANTDVTKFATIATGAEVNQNAFSNILVNGVTIQSDSKTDTFEIASGANITVTPDAVNDKLTIAVTGTVPSATTSGTCTGNSATATTAGTCTGNSATATTLQIARTINNVSFNGSANITVEPYIEQDATTNAARYLTFVDSSTAGYQRLNLDTVLTYNPSTNLLATSISGNASTATNATTAGGLAVNTTGVNNVANQIVRTNASGYIAGSYFNTTASDTTAASTSYFVETGGDGYIRPKSLANVKAELGIIALENTLIKEVVLTTASSDISATGLGLVVGEAYEYTLTIPTSTVVAYISLYADSDNARANYSAWLDTVGNGTGVAYVGYKAANTYTILEGHLRLTSGMPAMIMGRCYRSNGFLTQVAWNTNATKSAIGSLLFRCTDSGLSTTVAGFPVGTTLRIYKKN